jgi:3-hydroxyacyl-CoA dehydrogenase, NAD binding domain
MDLWEGSGQKMMRIETVAVLGTDEAASGCAMLAALSGCAVRVHHLADDALDAAFEALRFQVDLSIERGVLTRTDRQRILDGVLFTPDLTEAVTGADLVAELPRVADPGPGLDRAVRLVRATAVLAASDLETARELAGRVLHPGRVVALTVDASGGFARLSVVGTPHTTAHALAGAETFAARLNARGRHEG